MKKFWEMKTWLWGRKSFDKSLKTIFRPTSYHNLIPHARRPAGHRYGQALFGSVQSPKDMQVREEIWMRIEIISYKIMYEIIGLNDQFSFLVGPSSNTLSALQRLGSSLCILVSATLSPTSQRLKILLFSLVVAAVFLMSRDFCIILKRVNSSTLQSSKAQLPTVSRTPFRWQSVLL